MSKYRGRSTEKAEEMKMVKSLVHLLKTEPIVSGHAFGQNGRHWAANQIAEKGFVDDYTYWKIHKTTSMGGLLEEPNLRQF